MTDLDMSDTIAPKSDQLDAVDLLGGDRTFTIERISRNNDEQPFNFHLAGFPRPWRPGLSMRRVLMACWGKDAATYVGRRVTLYCDPDVQFGGAAVGGTRIRALSHIDKPKQVPLLIKRGKSAIFTVKPLTDAPAPAQESPLAGLLKELHAGMTALGITERDEYLAFISGAVDRTVLSTKELTAAEASRAIEAIKAEQAKDAEPPLPGAES
jgi:hypothetical protein